MKHAVNIFTRKCTGTAKLLEHRIRKQDTASKLLRRRLRRGNCTGLVHANAQAQEAGTALRHYRIKASTETRHLELLGEPSKQLATSRRINPAVEHIQNENTEEKLVGNCRTRASSNTFCWDAAQLRDKRAHKSSQIST